MSMYFVACYICDAEVEAVRDFEGIMCPPGDWKHVWLQGSDPITCTYYACPEHLEESVRALIHDMDDVVISCQTQVSEEDEGPLVWYRARDIGDDDDE